MLSTNGIGVVVIRPNHKGMIRKVSELVVGQLYFACNTEYGKRKTRLLAIKGELLEVEQYTTEGTPVERTIYLVDYCVTPYNRADDGIDRWNPVNYLKKR